MFDESEIRRLLIESCYSSQAADDYFRSHLDNAALLSLLIEIARDEGDYQGDAPMQAAYWVSQYSQEFLVPHERLLLEMLPIVNGYGGHVALALGKTGSQVGRQRIVYELGDGSRFDAWLFEEALRKCDALT